MVPPLKRGAARSWVLVGGDTRLGSELAAELRGYGHGCTAVGGSRIDLATDEPALDGVVWMAPNIPICE